MTLQPHLSSNYIMTLLGEWKYDEINLRIIKETNSLLKNTSLGKRFLISN